MEHAKIQRRNAIIEQKLELEERLTKIRNQELHQKQRYESGQPQLKRHVGFTSAFEQPVLTGIRN